MVRLRIRLPSGQNTCDVNTYGELCAIVNASIGDDAQTWNLLTGYPPAPLPAVPGADDPLSNFLKSGETVVVKLGPASAPAASAPAAPPPVPVAVPAVQQQSAFAASALAAASGGGGGASGFSAFAASARGLTGAQEEEEQLRIALALSLGESGGGGEVDPVCVPVPPQGDGEKLVRRVIPADNSCLFAAIAHAFGGSAGRRERANKLRKVVCEAVLANSDEYPEAVLGKSPSEYVEWISQPDSWGGGIEVAILAEHFGAEIATFDVQTQRVDTFGQGKGRSTRAYLLYDGVHYDLIVKALFDGAPEDLDVAIFEASDDAATMAEARMLVAEQHKARKFTDTGNFTLRCLVCQRGLVGQEGALAHAKETGHANFSEYK